MKSQLLQKYRYSLILLRELVITDFKLRYQSSALGYVWSLLRPLFMFVILYTVFVYFFKIGGDIPHFPVYLLLGIVLWNFFSEITNMSVTSIVSQVDVIRKLNFPRYVIILSRSISAMINLALNLVIVAIFMVINQVELTSVAILAPIFVIEIYVFALSVGFILSALFVRLRDVNYIWEVIMQALFYATPILYPLSQVSDKWPWAAQLLLLNPVAQAMQDIRWLVVTEQTGTLFGLSKDLWITLVPIAITVITAIFAVWFFKKRSPYFAEEV
jgi:ABC-2 type transport system permease protein